MNLLLTYNDGGAPQKVASSYNAILSKNQYGTRALNLLVYLINTLHKGVAHINKQSDKFSLVDIVGRHLTKVHTLLQQFFGNLSQVIDFGNSDHCIASQMGVDDDGLWVGVTDYSKTLMTFKLIEFVFEA